MKSSTRYLLSAAALGIPWWIGGCKEREGRIASELGDAGYTLTNEDWFRAATTDDVAAMERFITAGFQPDSRDAAGDSALHHAAAAGATEAAGFLLRRGIAIDIRGAGERTPLMAAVAANRTAMVGWLLRQGANPGLQDAEDFRPIMMAVRHGAIGAIGEIAPYHRDELDSALLLAALLGDAAAIDTLTNFGASVYARMEDGRTPLMLAAENGHADAVTLLVDIGASRFAIDEQGLAAADHAREAGHEDLVALILREPAPGELMLESPEEVAVEMAAFVEAARTRRNLQDEADGGGPTAGGPAAGSPPPSRRPTAPPPLDGQRLGGATGVATAPPTPVRPADPALDGSLADPAASAGPPLVMRHYRAREMPIEVGGTNGQSVGILIRGSQTGPVDLAVGESIPGTRLVILQIHRRMETSKVNPAQAIEVSIVEVEDSTTGERREWRSGLPASAHDPVALVEDAATGNHYITSPGQRFHGADGMRYTIVDVRPNQLVVEDADGLVQTHALRGPRG